MSRRYRRCASSSRRPSRRPPLENSSKTGNVAIEPPPTTLGGPAAPRAKQNLAEEWNLADRVRAASVPSPTDGRRHVAWRRLARQSGDDAEALRARWAAFGHAGSPVLPLIEPWEIQDGLVRGASKGEAVQLALAVGGALNVVRRGRRRRGRARPTSSARRPMYRLRRGGGRTSRSLLSRRRSWAGSRARRAWSRRPPRAFCAVAAGVLTPPPSRSARHLPLVLSSRGACHPSDTRDGHHHTGLSEPRRPSRARPCFASVPLAGAHPVAPPTPGLPSTKRGIRSPC